MDIAQKNVDCQSRLSGRSMRLATSRKTQASFDLNHAESRPDC
jgi:hypothetical protein